jgi:hypothetical protein
VDTARSRSLLALFWAAVFVLLATANAGGYRYGTSDQAFYIPAILRALDPGLFPRDGWLIQTQSRLLVLDELIAWLVARTHVPLTVVFFGAYLASGLLLGIALWGLGRFFGLGAWTTATFVVAMSLRHRVAATGVNTFEGYFHPRMLAAALGMAALCTTMASRPASTALLIAGALVVHPTTAVWFAVLVSVAWCVQVRDSGSAVSAPRSVKAVAVVVASGAVAGAVALAWRSGWLAESTQTMDEAWIALLASKDYLFPAAWPGDAWLVHGLAGAALVGGYVWRRRRRQSVPHEGAVVAGALALVALFLLSLPLVASGTALAVQLQISRTFWPIEILATLYAVWALAEGGTRWPADRDARSTATRRRAVVFAIVLTAATARGAYVTWLEAPGGELLHLGLPSNAWSEAMAWARDHTRQDAHFLVDPGHAWKFGVSFRVGAERDVYLEEVKDVAMALYARPVAARVLTRIEALGTFDTLTTDHVRRLAGEFDLDYLVAPHGSPGAPALPFPVVWRNDRFAIYRLQPAAGLGPAAGVNRGRFLARRLP